MEFGKICTYITVVYANCKNSYQVTLGKYLTKQKAEKEVKKKKGSKVKKKINEITTKQDKVREGAITKEIKGENTNLELREKSIDKPIDENSDLNIKNTDWTKSLTSLFFFILRDFECYDSKNSWEY